MTRITAGHRGYDFVLLVLWSIGMQVSQQRGVLYHIIEIEQTLDHYIGRLMTEKNSNLDDYHDRNITQPSHVCY